MKAIIYILRSYLRRRFLVLLLILAAVYCTAVAFAITKQHPRTAWCFALYAFVFITGMVGVHLKQITEGSATELLPNYRKFQLLVAGLILAFFLIWPVLFSSLFGIAAPITIASFLFFMCLALWIAFSLGNGLIAILGVLSLWWLLADIFKLAGPLSEASRLGKLGTLIGPFWPAYTIAMSAAGLLIFVHYYLSITHTSNEFKNHYQVSIETGDWIDPIAIKAAAKTISKISEMETVQRLSLYQQIRLFQFSLFSPVYSVNVYYEFIGALFIAAILTYLSFHQSNADFSGANFYMPFGYYWLTCVIAADFLSHRNRIAAIYLRAHFPSRSFFMKASILSYLLVICKQMLSLTLAMIIVAAIFPWASWTYFFPLCVLGLILSFIQVALSLLASHRIVTPAHSLGWLMINMFSVFLLIPVSKFYSHIWIIIAAILPLSAILFWLALRKWVRSELDFA